MSAFRSRSLETASIPVAYCTAHYGLIYLATLKKEESVLITRAASASDHAAHCLSQMVGAETCATVDSTENSELLKKVYNMPDDHIFSNKGIFSGHPLAE